MERKGLGEAGVEMGWDRMLGFGDFIGVKRRKENHGEILFNLKTVVIRLIRGQSVCVS